jgi:hypothetical protein
MGRHFQGTKCRFFVDDTLNGCNDGHFEEAMPFKVLIAKAQECAQIRE